MTFKNGKIKIIIFEIMCVVVVLSIIGYTYSYFQVQAVNTGSITGEAAALNLDLTVTRISPTTDKKLIPQLDSAITSAVIGRKGSCIDDNNNAVCQVYQVTVKNLSGVTSYVDGILELTANNNPNLKWALISGTTEPTLKSEIKTHDLIEITLNEKYVGNAVKNYYIVVWISETGFAQMDSGKFNGVVTFGNSEPTSPAATTIYSLGIIPKKDVLTTFTSTSETDGTKGVYKAEDDLGTSYYWRGAVENNYVKFGKNSSGSDMYWRIVRINGDGTIRMIYDGTQPHANGTSSTDRQIGTSVYNTNYADNAFIGYMNGTIDGTNFPSGGTNSTSYAEAHANTTNSTIKTYIDNWYKTNIEDTGYASHVADAIYCNDRKITTNQDLLDLFSTMIGGVTVPNTGFGGGNTSITLYGFYDKIKMTAEGATESVTPTLTCTQENDRFTKNATVGNVAGNAKLTYSVGLLTTDEAFFAGGYSVSNKTYYLYTGQWYWTASPGFFSDGRAIVRGVGSGGSADGTNRVDRAGGVRPAISLSSTAITGGSGTTTDPFTVS